MVAQQIISANNHVSLLQIGQSYFWVIMSGCVHLWAYPFVLSDGHTFCWVLDVWTTTGVYKSTKSIKDATQDREEVVTLN